MTSGPPFAMEWWLIEGDTEDWIIEVRNPMTGELRDLSGTTVTLTMVPSDDFHDTTLENADCTHNNSGGTVTYDTQLADVDSSGDYYAQLKIVTDEGVKHYPEPQDGRWAIHIRRKFESTDTAE